jgi:hypothetical protein
VEIEIFKYTIIAGCFYWSFEDGFVATSGKSSWWVVAEKILRSLGAFHHLQPINLAHSNF